MVNNYVTAPFFNGAAIKSRAGRYAMTPYMPMRQKTFSIRPKLAMLETVISRCTVKKP